MNWPGRTAPRPAVGAHRLGAALGPENSLAALDAAQAAGADFAEADLRLTWDGQAAVLHDADLARLTGDPATIADLTMEQARQRLPGLLEWPTLVAARGAMPLLIDLKITDPHAAGRVARALGPLSGQDGILLGLRSAPMRLALAGFAPHWPRLALLPPGAGDSQAGGFDWVRLWQAEAQAGRIAALRAAGHRVMVMTGDPGATTGRPAAARLDAVLAAGPDALMIDDPRPAIARRSAIIAADAAPMNIA